MPATPQEVRDIHARLTTELSDYIDQSIDRMQYDQVINRLKSVLTPKARKDANNIMDILESMEKKGFIGPGKYDGLKKILHEFDVKIVEVVEKREEQINAILFKNQEISPIQSLTYVSSTSSTNDSAVPVEKLSPNNKQKAEIAIPDSVKHVYEKSIEQQGLLLILNFSKNREGSDKDVDKLKDFFKDNFNFEVESELDLTKEKLQEVLTEIRDDYLNSKRISKKYYCFICVVMSHGDEKGIRTNDGQSITMDEITEYFKNKSTPNFLGKPKIFIVQACQGSRVQPTVESDEWEDIDDFVGKMSVPHDADILIAYATTPGHKAFRTKYSDIGAWFIHVLLEVIKEFYETEHFEEILISVRHKLAIDEEWRRCGYCQMPCSWTTLTKRLYLR